jgi:glycosyltransferase involved in cell wall biosynthesis
VQRLVEVAAARSVDVFQKHPRLRVGDDFIIYVGRVDPSKGCNQLFEYFLRYKTEHQTALKLVLIGKPTMPIPDHPDIIALGFLREEPFPWMAQARALVLPSEWESFSFVVLESMALGVPVLVNGASHVTRGHCQRSNGGLYYQHYDEFSAILSLLLARPELRGHLGQQGRAYVQQNYAWETLEPRFLDWLTWVAQHCAA